MAAQVLRTSSHFFFWKTIRLGVAMGFIFPLSHSLLLMELKPRFPFLEDPFSVDIEELFLLRAH